MRRSARLGYIFVIDIIKKHRQKGVEDLSGNRSEEEIVGMYIYGFFKGIYDFFKAVYYGIRKLPEKKSNLYVLLMYAALGIGLFLFRENIWTLIPEGNRRMLPLKYAVYGTPLLPLVYLYYMGESHRRFISEFDEKFDEIGLFTRGKKRDFNGNMVERKLYPRYMGEEKDGDITIYSFFSNIPLEDWRVKIRNIEIIMDCNILKIDNALSTKKVVKIKTVPASKIIPIYIDWKDEFLSDKDFEILVGENMLEQVKFDLNKAPHALVAGETGSGKSVILRMILRQGVLKAAKIYMIDFKGGVEFGIKYERYGEVITERQRALEVLKELVKENEVRLKLFRKLDVKNLAEYNKLADTSNLKKLCRIMVFCDEVAEMMDKSGLSRDAKKIFEEIEKEISTLARLARATGINLVLGMQRPDAKVLPGQIKNNVPVRISGRFADKPASEIVLSNSRATELPEIKGRFLFKVGADTLEFQAYNFDDSKMLTDIEVTKGGMLTQEDETAAEVKKQTNSNNITLEKPEVKVDYDFLNELEDADEEPLPFDLDEGPVSIEDFVDEEFEGFGFEEEEILDDDVISEIEKYEGF